MRQIFGNRVGSLCKIDLALCFKSMFWKVQWLMLRKSPCSPSHIVNMGTRDHHQLSIHHEFTTRSQRWSPCWACWSWPHWCWQKPQPPLPTTSSPAPYASTLSRRLVIASKIYQNCNCWDPWEESFVVGNLPMQLFNSFLSSFLVLFTKIIRFSLIYIKRSEFMNMFVVSFSCPSSSIPTYIFYGLIHGVAIQRDWCGNARI